MKISCITACACRLNASNYKNMKVMVIFLENVNFLNTIVSLFSGRFHLMTNALCVIVGNAEAERVLPVQNKIQTELRNRH